MVNLRIVYAVCCYCRRIIERFESNYHAYCT